MKDENLKIKCIDCGGIMTLTDESRYEAVCPVCGLTRDVRSVASWATKVNGIYIEDED